MIILQKPQKPGIKSIWKLLRWDKFLFPAVKASRMPLGDICRHFVFLCKPPPFKPGSVHKVQVRFIPLPMLPGSCVDSQCYQIYQFNRWPARSSAGISGVSKWVHLAKRVSEGGCSLGKKTQSTIRKTGMWMMQAVGGLLVTESWKRPSLDLNS